MLISQLSQFCAAAAADYVEIHKIFWVFPKRVGCSTVPELTIRCIDVYYITRHVCYLKITAEFIWSTKVSNA